MRSKSRMKRRLIGAGASLAGIFVVSSAMTFLDIPPGLRPHLYWLLSSKHYKQSVMAEPKIPNQLAHVEWNGDGWGGAPVGDWMGYVVFDPEDSLPQMSTKEQPRRIGGVPCNVVAVRRLGKDWFSVVTDMNEFWDSQHPECQR